MKHTHFLSLSLLSALCTLSSYGMHESVKKQIKDAEKRLQDDLKGYRGEEMEVLEIHDQHRDQLAYIVKKTDNWKPNQDEPWMSNQNKLKYLTGDRYYENRKKIVKRMIKIEKIDPNAIKIDYFGNPLSEAIAYKDIVFATYLLGRGAKPDAKTLERASSSPEIAALLSSSNKLQ